MLFSSNKPSKDPTRIAQFLTALNSARWREAPEEAISTAFTGVNEIIHEEILFYYRSGNKHRVISVATRLIAVLFGTLGVMAPLLAGANPARFSGFGAYGYLFLAGAGSAVAVNRLFGMTGGHVRHVSTQLELEQLVTLFRLDWCAWLVRTPSVQPQDVEKAVELLRTFALDAYKIVREETNVWGDSTTRALKEYADKLEAMQSRAAEEEKRAAKLPAVEQAHNGGS